MNNSLKALENLKKVVMPTLKILDFRKNLLEHFDFINLNFGELLELHLENNQIMRIDNISNNCTFPKLRELHLEKNQLESIDLRGLANMPTLEALYLNDNMISNIEGMWVDDRLPNSRLTLCRLPNLAQLHLQNNNLELFSMAGMNLPRLEVLYLQNNRLRIVIGPINAQLQALEFLNLSNNNLTNLNLAELNIVNLKRLSLVENGLVTIKCSPPTIFKEL